MKKLFQLISKNWFRSQPKLPISKNLNQRLPIITISREHGSGGRIIATEVVKRLGKPWKLYHKIIIDQIAKKAHLEKKLITEVDEKRTSFSDKLVSEALGKKYLSLTNYYKHLLKILSIIANRGYAVIIGRGANFLIPQALKVRIICEMEQRILWMMAFEKMTRAQAIESIEKSDENRDEFTQSLYHHNVRKAHHYDLVVRTGKDLGIEEAANLIVAVARKRFGI